LIAAEKKWSGRELNPRPLHCEREGDESQLTTHQQVSETPPSVCTSVCTSNPKTDHEMAPIDVDLAAIIKAWPHIPVEIRKSVVAIIVKHG